MSTPSAIMIMYGSHTFKTASSKVNLFYVPKDGSSRIFPSRILNKQASSSVVSGSSKGGTLHGKWITDTLDAEEGAVILVQTVSSTKGRQYLGGAIALQLRDGADLVKVEARLSANPDATYAALPAFVGMADILTPQEVLDLGCSLRGGYIRNYMDEEEVDEAFNVSILSKGTGKPPTVELSDCFGNKKKVVVDPVPRRRIRVRGK